MILSDLHTHTTFSDGDNTPEEMVTRAIGLGMATIGFSDHSYTSFDLGCCMKKEDISAYKEEISRLKEKYKGKIEVLCGIEQDYYSDEQATGYDYVIGSVHYLKLSGKYYAVDDTREIFEQAAREHFGGDCIALTEEYFRTVRDVVSKTGCDIIGHFDLVTKFNGQGYIDENDPRYIRAWREAVDKLIPCGKPFEINTGGIARGYKTTPYPAPGMIDYIKLKGGRLILSSDAHNVKGLCGGFDEWKKLI